MPYQTPIHICTISGLAGSGSTILDLAVPGFFDNNFGSVEMKKHHVDKVSREDSRRSRRQTYRHEMNYMPIQLSAGKLHFDFPDGSTKRMEDE